MGKEIYKCILFSNNFNDKIILNLDRKLIRIMYKDKIYNFINNNSFGDQLYVEQ